MRIRSLFRKKTETIHLFDSLKTAIVSVKFTDSNETKSTVRFYKPPVQVLK